MFAGPISASFIAAALTAQAPQMDAEPRWTVSPFNLYVERYNRLAGAGYLLLMTGVSDLPSAMFECSEGQIFATIAANGGDPRAQLAEQWSDTVQRRVRWSAAGADWSRREPWAYLESSHHFRPVDFATKIAMWESAKAGSSFAILFGEEEIRVDWPEPDDANGRVH